MKFFESLWFFVCLPAFSQARHLPVFAQPQQHDNMYFTRGASFVHPDGRNCSYVDTDPMLGYECEQPPAFLTRRHGPSAVDNKMITRDENTDLIVDAEPGKKWTYGSGLTQIAIAGFNGGITGYFVLKYYTPLDDSIGEGGSNVAKCFRKYSSTYNFIGSGSRELTAHYCLDKNLVKGADPKYCNGFFPKSEATDALEKGLKKARAVYPGEPEGAFCIRELVTPFQGSVRGDPNTIQILGRVVVTNRGDPADACGAKCTEFIDA